MKWVEIRDFPNYFVTDGGLVKYKGKPLKPKVDRDGYLQVSMFKNGKWYHKKVHRLVAEYFVPNPDNLPTVDHIDGNKRNNKANNLRWADEFEQRVNVKDDYARPIIAHIRDEYKVFSNAKRCANHFHVPKDELVKAIHKGHKIDGWAVEFVDIN